ncbi:universal stress protein [Sphingomonas lacunae]|uniref:Universal stress protein n=1 Tax=Sphingomonas lacunae TaxID=2698828 RepID=A0A6M4AUN1_9SPHN|nr:universal stress protein [Sphingomonas lacunae]QJQ32012.1 universal stress protein [Sphingomonas lacunae]
MRSILVHADGHNANEGRLQSALDLCRAVQGHVTLHINTPLQRFVAMDPFGGVFLSADAIADAQAHDAQLVDRFAERLGHEDVSWNIETSSGELVDGLTSSARLADLIIVSLPATGETSAGTAAPVGGIAVSARCPVLALPAAAARFPVEGKVMVCWDGGHESANALRAAIPLLALASRVDVVTVTEKSDGFPSTQALRYLSNYGIHAELHERERQQLSIEEVLDNAAAELGSDWLVLGAYGHSRLRETLFGGVTRFFIESGNRPLLLAH